MPISETAILRPIDPAVTDSDKWEIFVLNDASVIYESNGRPASLLAAYADTPLKVEGRLEGPTRGQARCFLEKPYKPQQIEVRKVTRFSYGEMTDGAYVMWAQGKAGWFEIRPAPHYQSVFDDTCQAVELLYFVTDIYSGSRKKGGGPSAQLVFQEYAEDERFTCADRTQAERIFQQHSAFLTMCFLNRTHGINWSNTPLYQYFKKRSPKGFEACKARVEGRSEASSSKTSPVPASAKSHTARGKQAIPKPEKGPKKDDNWWEAATLFEFMQKAVNQRVLRPGRNVITLQRVAELVVKRYEIEELETAQNVLLVHAQNLCYMMDHPRRKNIQFFASESIYEELKAGHSLSATEQRKAEGVELKPRRDHATLRDGETESSDTSDEEEEDIISTPVRRPPGRRKRGRFSVLRPKSSKYSGKSKGKGKAGKGKAPILDSSTPSDASEPDQKENPTSSDEEMSIDTPTHALSPGRDKRKLDPSDAEVEELHHRRKRAASTSITPDSPPTSTNSDEDDNADEAEDVSAVPPLPLRYKPTTHQHPRPSSSSSKPTILPPLVSTPLPTYEANASRDSWICSFDGCAQRIYGCSKDLGRQLITEHLEDHAKGREKVVGILWSEQGKLHLPVSNLIKKIREMSEASTPLFPAAGPEKVVQPQAIRRPV